VSGGRFKLRKDVRPRGVRWKGGVCWLEATWCGSTAMAAMLLAMVLLGRSSRPSSGVCCGSAGFCLNEFGEGPLSEVRRGHRPSVPHSFGNV
jgi:hypothetical protein